MFRISESVDGMTIAPPAPSSTRPALSCAEVPEVAATTDATPRSAKPMRNSLRRPKRSPPAAVVTSRPPGTGP